MTAGLPNRMLHPIVFSTVRSIGEARWREPDGAGVVELERRVAKLVARVGVLHDWRLLRLGRRRRPGPR